QSFDSTSHIVVMNHRVLLIDFKKQKLIADVPIQNATSACRLNNRELIAVTDNSWGLYKIDITTNRISENHQLVFDQYNNRLNSPCFSVCTAADNNVYVSTRSAGLVRFNPGTKQFYSYRHDPLNAQTISENILRRVMANKDGYLMITSISGVNFTNVLYNMFRQQNYFKDRNGNIYDGSVIGIAEDKNKQIWLSTLSGLFIWNPSSSFVKPLWKTERPDPTDKSAYEPGRLASDGKGNIWASLNWEGISIYNIKGKLIKQLRASSKEIPSDRIRTLKQLNDSLMAVGTEDGLFIINSHTFKTAVISNDTLFQEMMSKRIVDIMIDKQKLWVASSPVGAAYCYDFSNKKIKKFNSLNGLSSNRVYCLAKDSIGNVYVGTYDGLNIIDANWKIRIINKQNGLRHPRIENLVTDKNGFVWITNFNSLIRFDPIKNNFNYFDERNGVTNAGFRVVSNCITSDGEIFLGSTNGLLIVKPDEPIQPPGKKHITIQRIYDDRRVELMDVQNTLKLSYDNAKLSLYYLTADLISGNRYLYRYKLDGLDTAWSSPTKVNQVTYDLKPGKYQFKVQASYNQTDWIETGDIISIDVSPPFWETWWFRSAILLLISLLIYWFVKRRITRIKMKAAIRQQITELESKALRAQMNPHFIFNSLNAIQELIVTKNFTEAYQYLSNFSKLLRMVLNNSEKNFIPLSAEIEMNKHYLQLESLRFKQSFHYELEVEESIDEETTLVPSLLLQPFIENAIWHGLMHKEGDKRLAISFEEINDHLVCMIEDNGIGREKSAAIKARKIGASYFESKGMTLSKQRIVALNQQLKENLAIRIDDMKDEAGGATGTRIIITIPKRTTFIN
ncbi:MAG: histidine kinase, partial [Chitinophagaceae bacterium]